MRTALRFHSFEILSDQSGVNHPSLASDNNKGRRTPDINTQASRTSAGRTGNVFSTDAEIVAQGDTGVTTSKVICSKCYEAAMPRHMLSDRLRERTHIITRSHDGAIPILNQRSGPAILVSSKFAPASHTDHVNRVTFRCQHVSCSERLVQDCSRCHEGDGVFSG